MRHRRIRVLRVIARLNMGGPAIQAITLTSDLDPSRYESLLATGTCGPGEEEMTSLLQGKGVAPIRINGLGRALSLTDDARAFVELAALIRRFQPDILHTHTAKAGALGRAAGLLLGVPKRVHTFHGHVFHGYFSPLKSQAAILTERALALAADRIVAISELQKEELCDVYKIASPQKTVVVPLGFDLSSYLSVSRGEVRGTLRQEIGAGAEDILVGVVGRIAPIKNHSLFLRGFALAQKKVPYLRAVIIGGGTEEDLLQLKTFAASLQIAERVHFLGYRSLLAPLYADLDIVALSSDNEGTPVALIEALAAGRACLSTNVGGVSDVLGEGRYGVMVPPKEAGSFGDALASLAQSKTRREELQRVAPLAAEQRYGITRLLSDIDSLYQTLR